MHCLRLLQWRAQKRFVYLAAPSEEGDPTSATRETEILTSPAPSQIHPLQIAAEQVPALHTKLSTAIAEIDDDHRDMSLEAVGIIDLTEVADFEAFGEAGYIVTFLDERVMHTAIIGFHPDAHVSPALTVRIVITKDTEGQSELSPEKAKQQILVKTAERTRLRTDQVHDFIVEEIIKPKS